MHSCLKILYAYIPRGKKILAALAIIIILFGFTEQANLLVGNWYQQFMPNIGNRSISDIFFLDSLTGWAVTNATNQNPDTMFILKTTNSGDNWTIQYRKIQTGGGFPGYFRVYFINQNTGFACFTTGFEKTINGGANWATLNAPSNSYLDMSIIDENTIWLVSSDGLTGGVYFTSNGGASWQQQLFLGSQNPSKIYMYNARIGFVSSTAGLYKTTNSGNSWFAASNDFSFSDMYFLDSLTGWKASGTMKKTTNGGLNWQNETLPQGGNIILSQITKFSNINRDTIWGVGGHVFYSNGIGNRGMIYKTINGGDTWLYQIPDTLINIGVYNYVKFYNKQIGWAYSNGPGIHTTNGGDTNFLTGIKQVSNVIPKEFKLFQNFPNPFNPVTNIKYQITLNGKSKKAEVKIIVYNIQGKEIETLVNEEQNAGTYQVDFSGNGLSSGVYFYKLIIGDREEEFTETKKMILIK